MRFFFVRSNFGSFDVFMSHVVESAQPFRETAKLAACLMAQVCHKVPRAYSIGYDNYTSTSSVTVSDGSDEPLKTCAMTYCK